MTGAVEMKTKLSLPPGAEDVADRLRLAGSFHIPEGHFTNEKVQESNRFLEPAQPGQANWRGDEKRNQV